MTSIEQNISSKSGSPGAPGKTFDELFAWNVDDDGVPFHMQGPETVDEYLPVGLLGSNRGETGHWISGSWLDAYYSGAYCATVD